MNDFVALIAVFLLAVLPARGMASETTKDIRPSRSDCIVGFQLDWSHVSDESSSRNLMQWPAGKQRIRFLSAMMFSPEGSELYFQFAGECDRKLEKAESLIRFWRSQHIDLPKFTRIQEPIKPTSDTIDAQGSSWRD